MQTPIYQLWLRKQGKLKDRDSSVFDQEWIHQTNILLSLLPARLAYLKMETFCSFEQLLGLICRLTEQGVWYELNLSLNDQQSHECQSVEELELLGLALAQAWKGKMIVSIASHKRADTHLQIRLAVKSF